MRHLNSKRVLATAAALSLVGGAGGAIAASKGSSTTGNGFLARVAGHLGISTQKLQDATKAAAIDQVDADLKAGRITQAQADQLKARINAGAVPFFGGPRGFHHEGVGHGEGLSAAAKYLGLTEPALMQKLAGGKSLADVAKAQSKSVDGLKQAMIADAKTHLDQAVKDGTLTDAQATQELNELKSRIDAIVNGTGPGPGDRHEFRFRSGPPNAGAWGPPAA
jgi:hypothetical protein